MNRVSKWNEFEKAYGSAGEWLDKFEQKVLQAGDKETLVNYEEVRGDELLMCNAPESI